MDPTALPTDNLYKFMALAGLMLTGFCVWLIWRVETWATAEAFRLKEAAYGLRAQTRVDRALRNVAAASNESRRLIRRTFGLQARHAIAASRIDQMLNQIPRVRKYRAKLRFAAWVGVATSCAGFYLWYVNAQWYTDRQTKADFEDHMADLRAKRVARDKGAHEAKP